MIHPVQFRDLIIRPTLEWMGPEVSGEAAETLLLFTAVVESHLTFLKQYPHGPALGVYQMEPGTHDWLVDVLHRPRWRNVRAWLGEPFTAERLVWDLRYATVLARLRYWVVPEPLPDPKDAGALARYWKRHYNTPAGKGVPAVAARVWEDVRSRYWL